MRPVLTKGEPGLRRHQVLLDMATASAYPTIGWRTIGCIQFGLPALPAPRRRRRSRRRRRPIRQEFTFEGHSPSMSSPVFQQPARATKCCRRSRYTGGCGLRRFGRRTRHPPNPDNRACISRRRSSKCGSSHRLCCSKGSFSRSKSIQGFTSPFSNTRAAYL